MRLGSSSAGAVQRRSRPLQLAVAFLFCAVIVETNGQGGRAARSVPSHPVMVTRLYSGADGQSHIDRVPVVFHGAPDEASADLKATDTHIARGAPGMFETWHHAGRRRYIAVISGEAEVVTTGGEKLRLVPGQIYLAEDLTGKGHTFRVIGNEDWVALFVNLGQ